MGFFASRRCLHLGQFLVERFIVVEGLGISIDHVRRHVLLRPQVRLVKGDAIRHVIVKDLAHRDGVVTVLVKMLGQSDHIGQIDAKFALQIPDASRVGPESGHRAGTRRCARGGRAIGLHEGRRAL